MALVAQPQFGGLCGFLGVAIRPCDIHGTVARIGYIEGWYVDPDVRRLGIGKSLLKAAEAWGMERGRGEILSDAQKENSPSQTCHEALGFIVVER